MSYEAIARKYRPETFAEVVGQAHVTDTLRAAVRRDKLSHAYLFSGPRGCGKTTVARLLAKAINCPHPSDGDPCGTCDSCKAIARGSYLDVLEIDAASNTGVDNIRELRDMAQYSPSEGGSRVFIIDEVHMLSKGAFNALLKILEEPPARVFFFFATTEVHKIPRTILSRCQRFDFRLLNQEELEGRMVQVASAEGVTLDAGATRLLVSLAEGSLRDGLSLLDQVLASCEDSVSEEAVIQAFGLIRSEVYLDLTDAIVAHDPKQALKLVSELAKAGQSLGTFARGIVTNFRNLMLLKIDPELGRMVDLPADQLARIETQASHFSEQDLLALIDRSSRHFERIYRSTQPQILLEASVVEYTRFESRVLLSDLSRRLEALSSGNVGSGGSGRPVRRDSGRQNRTSGASLPKSAHKAGGHDFVQDAVATPNEGPTRPAAGETVPGWTRLIEVLMQKAPRVGACLMNGLPSFTKEDGRLIIAFAPDKGFQVRNIEGDREKIAALATELWGVKVKVDLVLGQQGQDEIASEDIRRKVAPTQNEELKKACTDDPALERLVEMMDAAPLADGEKEQWEKNSD